MSAMSNLHTELSLLGYRDSDIEATPIWILEGLAQREVRNPWSDEDYFKDVPDNIIRSVD